MPTYQNIAAARMGVRGLTGTVAVLPGGTVQSLDKLDLMHPGVFDLVDVEPRLDPTREVEAVSEDETTGVPLELLRRDLDRVLLSAEVVAGGPAAGTLEVYVRPHGQEAWHGTDMAIDLAAPVALVIDAPVSAILLGPLGVSAGARFRAVARQF